MRTPSKKQPRSCGQAPMPHVYVKDSEGFVFKKNESEVAAGEKIISEKEYMKKSGLALYEKKFGHGLAR